MKRSQALESLKTFLNPNHVGFWLIAGTQTIPNSTATIPWKSWIDPWGYRLSVETDRITILNPSGHFLAPEWDLWSFSEPITLIKSHHRVSSINFMDSVSYLFCIDENRKLRLWQKRYNLWQQISPFSLPISLWRKLQRFHTGRYFQAKEYEIGPYLVSLLPPPVHKSILTLSS